MGHQRDYGIFPVIWKLDMGTTAKAQRHAVSFSLSVRTWHTPVTEADSACMDVQVGETFKLVEEKYEKLTQTQEWHDCYQHFFFEHPFCATIIEIWENSILRETKREEMYI